MLDYQALSADYLAVWNEDNPAARAAAAQQLFAEEVTYTDPLAAARGRQGLTDVITGVQQQFPGWRFRRSGVADGHGNHMRFSWELGPEGGAAPVAGFDVAVLGDDGRICQVVGFLDRVPA